MRGGWHLDALLLCCIANSSQYRVVLLKRRIRDHENHPDALWRITLRTRRGRVPTRVAPPCGRHRGRPSRSSLVTRHSSFVIARRSRASGGASSPSEPLHAPPARDGEDAVATLAHPFALRRSRREGRPPCRPPRAILLVTCHLSLAPARRSRASGRDGSTSRPQRVPSPPHLPASGRTVDASLPEQAPSNHPIVKLSNCVMPKRKKQNMGISLDKRLSFGCGAELCYNY